MIGREGELRQAESFLDTAGAGTRGLLLRGEAGIGKTTIWHAVLGSAERRGFRVILTRPTEAEARLPFAGLNDLFGELADVGPPELPPPQQAALDTALMRASAVSAPIQPLALSLAVLELLRFASSRQPIAVAIDDVQWLDESTAGVMRFALRRLDTAPVVVIATERTGLAHDLPAILADLPADHVLRVPIQPLGAAEIDHLLDGMLSMTLTPTVRRRVHRLAAGNPFHALELGRALEAGAVDPATGRVRLPDSVGGLVRARLAALPTEAHVVSVHAAALSHPTADLLEAAVGRQRARTGLEQARDAAVLAPADDPIRFTHPMLATEAYGGLEAEDRREVHRRLSAVVDEPEELARHLALAASGPDPAVTEALDAAATHAHGRGASDAAAELSELAADLTDANDPVRASRMAASGRYRLMAGDVGRARDLLERALAEPTAKRGAARAELLFRLAGVRQLMDDFVAAEELGRQALRHARDEPGLTVQIKLLLAGISFITGRHWDAGSRHASEAMELAERLGDPQLQAATIGAYATWRYATGRGYDPELARRAAELEPWTARFRTLDLPDFDIANIEFNEGETASALARWRSLLERAERDGDYSSLPFLLANVTVADFLEGRSDLARERLDRATRLSQATDQRVAQVHTLATAARLAARLGDADRAIEAGRAAFEAMSATSWRVGEWWMRADLALLELSRGDAAAAFDLAAGAPDASQADPAERRRWAQGVAIEALAALGRFDEARTELAEFEQRAGTHGSPRLHAERLRAAALLHAADGDLEAAAAAIGEAEAIHRRIEDPWELARTLLVAGDVHRRARRRAASRAALREALETFTFLGARLWAERAREQLARIGAARAGGGLTPTQRRVAELVAGGLTNRQVADRLFMSAHTVEAHLSAIYRTLGISARAQLSDALATEREATRDSAGPARDSRRA